jgi:hypothetical protein
MKKRLVLVMACMAVGIGIPTCGFGQADGSAGLQQRLTTLEAAVAALQANVTGLKSAVTTLQGAVTSLQGQVSALQSQDTAQNASIATLQGQVLTLQNNGAQALAPYVSVNPNAIAGLAGPHVIFTGVNVHVRSGSGSSIDTLTGLGNLVVGYNERSFGQTRSGAHNLIVGREHEFSSHGGFVAGVANTISAPSASVSGGFNNTASGENASVSGGLQNTASSNEDSVSGGAGNTASGGGASVTGGVNNKASGLAATVSGGASVTESTTNGWAGGTFSTP